MSVRVLSNVFRHSESELAARLVLLALADSAHDDGITWIDQPRIAEKARLSHSHVRAVVKQLEAAGEVLVMKARRGRSTINVYRVLCADEEPDLKRLPAEIAALFSPAEIQRVNENVHPPILSDSPAESQHSAPYIGNRKETLEGAKAPTLARQPGEVDPDEPPPIVLSGTRNVPIDVLAEVCGVKQRSPQMKQVVTAMNGPSGDRSGIRHLFWHELCEWAAAHGETSRLATLYDEPERFAEVLADGIRKKAARYMQTMHGAMLTPTALRKWWLDIENRPDAEPATLSPEQIASGTWRE